MAKIINFTKARIAAYIKYSEDYRCMHKDLPRWADINGGLPSYARQYPGYHDAMRYMDAHKKIDFYSGIVDFYGELEELKENFATESTDFMFPTVMCKYRRGINPVTMLYNELQKTLFYFDKNNKTHCWLLGLFQDKEWFNKLIEAIEEDRKAITRFQLVHTPEVKSKTVERELSVLTNIKDNLDHYRDVFMLMSDTTKRYLK